jgi:hypothetical protein
MPLQAKIETEEQIPASFAEAMGHVAALIQAGDEVTSIESDDLIQVGDVIGGLYSAAERGFGFYLCFRDNDDEAIRDEWGTIEWCYYLIPEQIRGIADGEIRRLPMWRCSAFDCGRRWSRSDGYCPRCDFPP